MLTSDYCTIIFTLRKKMSVVPVMMIDNDIQENQNREIYEKYSSQGYRTIVDAEVCYR